MATGGDPVYTTETALGSRLQALLIDEATPLVRAIFDWEVLRMNPPNLQEQLMRNKSNLVTPSTDPRKKTLNFDQKKIVYPSNTTAANSSENFDIALLSLLLGILCHINIPETGWSKEPSADDNSPIAWIIRLRLFRNRNYGHITSTALPQPVFDSLWKELSVILIGLGADDRRISDRKTQDIDPDSAKMYLEIFERIDRHDIEVKDLVVAHSSQVVAQVSSLEVKVQRQTSKITKLTRMARHHLAPGAHQRRSTPGQTQGFWPFNFCYRNVEGIIIQKLRKHLRQQYRRKLHRIYPLPWCEDFYLDLGDIFTTLEMVRRDGLKKDITVTEKDMFWSHNDDDPKTIRVEGDPGIGKTTLCYKIIYDCSAKQSRFDVNNKFSSFKLVLYVEMRQVPHDATDVKSTIFKQVFPKAYYKHEEEFWDYVECNPEDVLFVLDGLDEMEEETRDKLKIAEFINGKIIGHIYVIVTSRPYLCNRQLTSCDRHFVIKGYSQENIKSYIERYENLDAISKEGMLKQLKENDSLHELTENPLNLALLCILWHEEWNNTVLPQTLTGLYSLLVLAIVKRYADKCPGISKVSDLKLEDMPEPIQRKLNDLSHLARTGIEEDHLNFSEKAVKGLVEIGFLTKDLNLTSTIQQPFWFKFLYKTFQEYFAARHLHSLCVATGNGEPSSEASEIMIECVQNGRYQQVLKFLAGLLGTNARSLFEAFHNCLSTNQDERIISLCLECLHECGAGKDLVRCVSDVLPKDWRVGSDTSEQEVEALDTFSHLHNVRVHPYIAENETLLPYSFGTGCFGMCILSSNSDQMPMKYKPQLITSNEALYGLVSLLQYQGETGQKLSSVYLRPGLDSATCRFLRKILDTKAKGIDFLAINIAHHDSELIEATCNLFECDTYRNLPCKLSVYPCNTSSLDNLNQVLSSVQTQTNVSLYSPVHLDGSFYSINTTVQLGCITEDNNKKASVRLYIDCAADKYIPDFMASSIANLVTIISNHQEKLCICPQGRLELLVIVRNLPLLEKQTLTESTLANISFILQHRCCILSNMTFECSCADGSVVSTTSLLQSLTVNQSLTEVSFLCDHDDTENVVRCLREIFQNSENRTLKKLEIGFLHPVDDSTMANIFSSYPVGSKSRIKSFSVVMETELTSPPPHTTVSYEKTIRAIVNICKNLRDGSALQQLSFITGPEIRPIDHEVTCPVFLLKPLVEAIAKSKCTIVVNLQGMTWPVDPIDIKDLEVTFQEITEYLRTKNFEESNLGHAGMGVTIKELFAKHFLLELFL